MPITRQTASVAAMPVYGAVSSRSGSHALGAVAGQAVHTFASPTQANKSSLGEYALAAAMDPQVQRLAMHAAKQTYANAAERVTRRKAQREYKQRAQTAAVTQPAGY